MIQPINSQNSINFKSIKTCGGKFTPVQEQLKDEIIKCFTTPDKHKKTVTEFYRTKCNAFRILPIADDKVELHRLTEVDFDKNNNVRYYRHAISEGIFDSENHKFDPKPYLKKLKLDWIFECISYGLIAGAAALSTIFVSSLLFKD